MAACLVTLRALIQELYMREEHKLPPERQLAEQLKVKRSTLRKALSILEDEKFIVRHVGRGTFLCSLAGRSPPQLRALATGGALAIDSAAGLSAHELMQVRYVLEPAIAELAAMAARKPDLDHIRECLARREQAQTPDSYEHWDYILHMSIAEATQNSLLIEMLDLVNRIRRTSAWRKFRRPSMSPEAKAASNADHRRIVEAISNADPSAAFNAMRLHLQKVSDCHQRYMSENITEAPLPSENTRST